MPREALKAVLASLPPSPAMGAPASPPTLQTRHTHLNHFALISRLLYTARPQLLVGLTLNTAYLRLPNMTKYCSVISLPQVTVQLLLTDTVLEGP